MRFQNPETIFTLRHHEHGIVESPNTSMGKDLGGA